MRPPVTTWGGPGGPWRSRAVRRVNTARDVVRVGRMASFSIRRFFVLQGRSQLLPVLAMSRAAIEARSREVSPGLAPGLGPRRRG